MPTPAQNALIARFQEASRLETAGRLAEAVTLLRGIVLTDPNMAPARFRLGVILTESGKAQEALPHLLAARKLVPTQAVIWHVVLQALGTLGDAKAIRAFEADIAKAPLPPKEKQALVAKIHRGDKADMGQLPKAEVDALIQEVMTASEDPAQLAQTVARAEDLHRRAPEASVATNILASAYSNAGLVAQASHYYRRAVAQDPMAPHIRANFGRFLMDRERFGPAVQQYSAATRLQPDFEPFKLMLASAALGASDSGTAARVAREILAANPANDAARMILVRSLERDGDLRGALELVEQVLSRHPTNPDAIGQKGHLLQIMGDLDGARATLEAGLALDDRTGSILRTVTTLHKFTPGDPLIDKLEALVNDTGVSLSIRNTTAFSLAKALEDSGQYDRVFTYLRIGNDAVKASQGYNMEAHHQRIRDALDGSARLDLPALARQAKSQYAPIFVTGMPRSGTTLTEQIIAAHSQITGVGEAGWLGEIANVSGDTTSVWSRFGTLPALDDLGARYEALARADFPEAGRIADKSLGHFHLTGLIAAAMPRARFVFLKRDPRDNLLSIYKNKFMRGAHPYNSDLRQLAEVYATYVEMVAYWQAMFPDRVYYLDYARLTAEPEAETRKLLAFCGLDWEDGVMSFHKNRNEVRTLSSVQVRQPIYTSSVRSWERYRDDLKPLLDALEEFGVAPSDD